MRPAIDVHAHYVAPELIEEAKRQGKAYGVGVSETADGKTRLGFVGRPPLRPFFPELCSLPHRLSGLDAAGVQLQVVSTWTDMAGEDLPGAEAAAWARLQNETIVSSVKASPDRFEAMGTLPMQDVSLALAELDHLVKRLGVRSVEIVSSINGRDLDAPEFRPLWRRLRDYEVFVLLHPPAQSIGEARAGAYFLNNVFSFPADTTMAAMRLIFGGVLQEFPGLRCCLAHGGGFLPYQIGRLDRGFSAHPACRAVIDRPPSRFLSDFYYDTLTHDTQALAYLVDKVGYARVLYGSDYPFEMLDEMGPDRIAAVAGMGPDKAQAILVDNAVKALGRTAPFGSDGGRRGVSDKPA